MQAVKISRNRVRTTTKNFVPRFSEEATRAEYFVALGSMIGSGIAGGVLVATTLNVLSTASDCLLRQQRKKMVANQTYFQHRRGNDTSSCWAFDD